MLAFAPRLYEGNIMSDAPNPSWRYLNEYNLDFTIGELEANLVDHRVNLLIAQHRRGSSPHSVPAKLTSYTVTGFRHIKDQLGEWLCMTTNEEPCVRLAALFGNDTCYCLGASGVAAQFMSPLYNGRDTHIILVLADAPSGP